MPAPALVPVDLEPAHRDLLRLGLTLWGGAARGTPAMARALGFADLVALQTQGRALAGRLQHGLSAPDWTRALLATEVCWASRVVGAADVWAAVSGRADAETLVLLRELQDRLSRAGVIERRHTPLDRSGPRSPIAAGAGDLVTVALDVEERDLLAHGLIEWGGPARCTEAMAVALGFASVVDLFEEGSRLWPALGTQPLSRRDWTRVLLATEVCWGGEVVGGSCCWPSVTGLGDEQSRALLRGVQERLAGAGVLDAALLAR